MVCNEYTGDLAVSGELGEAEALGAGEGWGAVEDDEGEGATAEELVGGPGGAGGGFGADGDEACAECGPGCWGEGAVGVDPGDPSAGSEDGGDGSAEEGGLSGGAWAEEVGEASPGDAAVEEAIEGGDAGAPGGGGGGGGWGEVAEGGAELLEGGGGGHGMVIIPNKSRKCKGGGVGGGGAGGALSGGRGGGRVGVMAPLSDIEIHRALASLPGWSRRGASLVKAYHFASFPAGIAFLARVAEEAERLAHHPDVDIRYTKVQFSLTTHDAGGITAADFVLARTIEGLAAA